ncbi:hypothetical protein BpHYR1_048544 [Brachionus plicatilis]|uniref:Uncharacterized protein n=1 Tax=Brachionus plicatilis TaxID=10195 RepID=A0A3M7QJR0_BRAPC|nr:hypothetical protein BpHYR1_048544 [Brachionus plicatilis]
MALENNSRKRKHFFIDRFIKSNNIIDLTIRKQRDTIVQNLFDSFSIFVKFIKLIKISSNIVEIVEIV